MLKTDEITAVECLLEILSKKRWEEVSSVIETKPALTLEADKLADKLSRNAALRGIPLPVYLRNLAAESPAALTPIWTAFLRFCYNQKNDGYSELEAAVRFLESFDGNCGFFYYLLNHDKRPSFESIVSHFEKHLVLGYTVALKSLQGEKTKIPTAIVSGLTATQNMGLKPLPANEYSNVWKKLRLPRLQFRTFIKLPAEIRKRILYNREALLAVLSRKALNHIRSDPNSCKQSPFYAYLNPKDARDSLENAIINGRWYHEGISALLTVFLNDEIADTFLHVGKKRGFGHIPIKDIYQIPNRRLRDAFLFSKMAAEERLGFIQKCDFKRLASIYKDTPTLKWPRIFFAIKDETSCRTVLASLRKAGLIEDLLKVFLADEQFYKAEMPHEYTGSESIIKKEVLVTGGLVLAGALSNGHLDLFCKSLLKFPERYIPLFESGDGQPIIKAALKSVVPDDHLIEILNQYGQIFVAACLDNLQMAAVKRIKPLVLREIGILHDLNRDIIRLIVAKCPHRLLAFLGPCPPVEVYAYAIETALRARDKTCKALLNMKDPKGIYLWEQLLSEEWKGKIPPVLKKIASWMKRPQLRRAFELRPDAFYIQAVKILPLRHVLLSAFRFSKAGLFLERKYSRSRLLNELEWVRETFNDRPTLKTAYEAALACSLADAPFLLHLTTCRWKNRDTNKRGFVFDHLYRTYPYPKKSGGNRTITVPEPRLKRLQRRILRNGLEKVPIHRAAHGFQKGRSTVTNAAPHSGKAMVVNVDISSFFPSTVHSEIVRACRKLASGRLSHATVMLIADICSYSGGLPVGAPTSPYIGNIILQSADLAIAKASKRYHITYTRYADDLTFSGGTDTIKILPFVKKVLKERGYKLDPKKTNIFRKGRRQIVTGLVVNERPNLPRIVRRRLRAAVHRIQSGQQPHWHKKEVSREKISGLIAYLNAVNPEEAATYKEQILPRKKEGKKK